MVYFKRGNPEVKKKMEKQTTAQQLTKVWVGEAEKKDREDQTEEQQKFSKLLDSLSKEQKRIFWQWHSIVIQNMS